MARQPPDELLSANDFLELSATAWTGISAIITLGLLIGAGVAAWYAKKQWVIARDQAEDARRAQSEASRPYIVVTIEPSAVSRHLFDLVVKNIGIRPALNVSITLDPPPKRARETPGYEIDKIKMLNEPIAMIAPGQEMRAYYDNLVERNNSQDDLPKSHRASLTYTDSSQHEYSEISILDIDAMKGTMYSDVKTLHDIGQILDKMEKTLRNASVLQRSGSLEVDAAIESRTEQQQRFAAEQAEREEQQRKFMERHRPAKSPVDPQAEPPEDSEPPEGSAQAPPG